MEIADVAFVPGGTVRLCTEADDQAARDAEIRALTCTLAKEARAAARLAAQVMADGWERPVQPHRVLPVAQRD